MFEKILGREMMVEINPVIDDILAMDRTAMSDEMVKASVAMLKGATAPEANKTTINDIVTEFQNRGFDTSTAFAIIEDMREKMNAEVQELNIDNEYKLEIMHGLIEALLQPFSVAANKLDGAALTVGWLKTEPNAVIPTYAHDTDACADLYAIEDMKIAKHTCGAMVRTGLKANIPDGWFLEIRSRSGMAAKTPLRIANSVGTVDSGYKGEIMVLFDNISGKDYEIKAGDRIAQIRPVPAYRFRSEEVTNIGDSDRGEGGFGSSGK